MAEFSTPETVFAFITGDFESIWNSLARAQDGNGGNFALALQSMILLEWAARLASTDKTGAALADFSLELEKIEPRYFVRLPSPVFAANGFELPSRGPDGPNQLIGALFDLIRNGHTHCYHQAIARLPDGDLFVTVAKVTGAASIQQLATASRNDHLETTRVGKDVGLVVRPDLLFLDFKRAIDSARLLHRGLTFTNFVRKPKGDVYKFSTADFESALRRSP